MKEQELRIGNWVEHNDEWCYRGEDVYQFQWDDSDWYALGESTMFIQNINPIPLTEQWLLDFGFEKDEYQDNYEKIGFDIRIYDGEFLYCAISEYFPAYSISITYVHELQNLYFALTGEELQL